MSHPLVVHHKKSKFDVYIGRPSPWGNPFTIGIHGSRAEVIALYRDWINGKIRSPDGAEPPTKDEIRSELRGKRLGCWCAPIACHGEYLAFIANQKPGLFSQT
jgi:hypothetical protein